MKSLNDLVVQAESLATNLEDDEIPHIQRSINQLKQRVGQLSYNRGAQNDIKAAKLLGTKVGYELSAGLSKTIESLQVLSSYDDSSDTRIEDIPSFLKNERETAILSSINITRNNTLNESHKRSEIARNQWWSQEKMKILGLLSSGDKLPLIVDVCVARGGDRLESEIHLGGKLGREETSYARQVAIYVEVLLSDSCLRQPASLFDIILGDEASPLRNTRNTELNEVARLINSYCQLSTGTTTADQRQSEEDLSKQMVSTALSHLERELLNYIKQCVDVLSLQSTDNIRLVIVTFLDTQMLSNFPGMENGSFEDGLVDGVPVWPLIYMCFRCGLYEEAIKVAKQASSNIGEWYTWLNEFVIHGRVSAEHTRKIVNDYKRNVRCSTDGCKRLLYCLVSGCDIEDNHGQVLLSVDDFMWARLTHLRRSYHCQDNLQMSLNKSRQSFGEHQSLLQLQRLVSEEYGESHFQARDQPVTFCKILFLCQLLEPALAFMARFEHLRSHAVHLGLVLWQKNLLMVPSTAKVPLLSRDDQDSQGVSRLNLARLVTLYTQSFESQHPKEALDLFYLLSDLPNDDENLFVSLTSTLVVEHGHLDLLLGFGESPGLVSRYGSVREQIVDSVASRLLETGRAEGASDILKMAGRLTEAAVIMTDLLASSLTLPSSHQQDVLRLRSKAEHLCHSLPAQCREAYVLSFVLNIVNFMSLSLQGDTDTAILALDKTDLLPSSTDAGRIRSSVESFRSLPEIVRNLVPSILVTAMKLIRQSAVHRRFSPESMADLRCRASALITFTGQLPYRMPADVYASLSQLELDIN